MFKKIVLVVIGLAVVIGGLAYAKKAQFNAMAAAPKTQPPETVTVTQVKKESWQPTLDAIGSVTAVQGVTVSTEAPGKVVRIAFESGDVVKEGDILVQLDTSTEEAQLRSLEAMQDLSHVNLVRAKELREKGTNSAADLDTADAEAKQAIAQVENIKASIAKKTIRAPFSGKLGLRQVNLGQFLNNGDPIVSLQSLDPVYVEFSLPQQNVSQLQTGLEVRASTDAYPGEAFSGKLTAVAPTIDTATRNLKIQATFANPKTLLHPGMFTRVEVVLPTTQEVLVIPATAVSYAPSGDSVYIVKDDPDSKGKIAEQCFVRLGEARGDFVVVTGGVKEGDTIVATGAFKLRNGASVEITDSPSPKPELAPKPADA